VDQAVVSETPSRSHIDATRGPPYEYAKPLIYVSKFDRMCLVAAALKIRRQNLDILTDMPRIAKAGPLILFAFVAMTLSACGAMFNYPFEAKVADPLPLPPKTNEAPTISPISNTSTPWNVAKVIDFGISDSDSILSCSSAHLSMSSADTSLVANAAVTFGGTVPNCRATLTPQENQQGSALITITVSDGTLMNQTVFSLSVSGPQLAQSPNTSGNNWYSIASDATGNKLVAASYGGFIHTSSDAGATWVRRLSAGDKKWGKVVSSSDGMRLAAIVGFYANRTDADYVYTSADGGVTWVARTGSGQRAWSALASSADGTKLVATVFTDAGGYLYTSTDAGVTWTEQTAAGRRHWAGVAMSSDGNKIAGGLWDGDGGMVVTGANSTGNWTWTVNPTGGGVRWIVGGSADFSLLAINGTGNDVSLSFDGGATWATKALPGTGQVRGLAVSADGKVIVVGTYNATGGAVYTSKDNGTTWHQEIAMTDSPQNWGFLVASNSTGSKLAFAQGSGSFSVDLGLDSLQQAPNTEGQKWNSVASDTSGTKLAAVVFGGYIYTSTNSGLTWTPRTSAGFKNWGTITSSADGMKLAATVGNHDNEYQSGGADIDYIYTSSDGGATWVAQTNSGQRHWSSITSSADGTKLAATTWKFSVSTAFLYTSSDSGVTWTQQTAAGGRHWQSIVSSPDGTKLAASLWDGDGGGVVTGTYAAGAWTWTLNNTGGWDNRWVIAGSADLSLLAINSNNSDITLSTDGGSTWSTKAIPGGEHILSIDLSHDGSRLVIGTYNESGEGAVYSSVDQGTSWTFLGRVNIGGPYPYFVVNVNAAGNQIVAAQYGGAISYIGGGSIWTVH